MVYTYTRPSFLIREPHGTYIPSGYTPLQPEQLFDDTCIIFQQRFNTFKKRTHPTSFQEEEALRIMLEGLISMKNLIFSTSQENQE